MWKKRQSCGKAIFTVQRSPPLCGLVSFLECCPVAVERDNFMLILGDPCQGKDISSTWTVNSFIFLRQTF